MLLNFNLWSQWFDNDVQHTNFLHFYNTCNGFEYISTTFNIKTYVFHKRHFGLTSKFFNTLKAEVQKSPNDCPLIILGNFNIDILDDINHKNNKQKLIEFMNCKSKSQFKNNKTNFVLFFYNKFGNQIGDFCF